jgi:hypothetical protein
MLGQLLQAPVDGGLDHDAFLEITDQVGQLLGDPIDDILGGRDVIGGLDGGVDAGRLVSFGPADEAAVDHFGNDETGALGSAFRMVDRVEGRRRIEHRGEDRCLRQSDVARRLAEILLGRLFHTGGAGAEIDPVEIELQDLVLGISVLEPQSQHRLLELALVGAVGIEKQVLGQLLGYGRAALNHPAGLIVGEKGAAKSDRVDAEVVIETTVLDGDDGLWQVARQLVDPDLVAEERSALGHHMAVGRQQHHAGLALGHLNRPCSSRLNRHMRLRRSP